jgi:hypothetical protein
VKKKRRVIFVVSMILAILGSACLGYGVYRCLRRCPNSPPTIQARIPKVHLTLMTIYKRCGHKEEMSKIFERDLEEIFEEYKGWRIESDQKDNVLLVDEASGLCPICEREEFLGIFQDKVAVFHGRPMRRGPVKEVSSLEVKDLPSQEAEDLSQGIHIKDIRERLQLLEGLFSLKDG